MAKRKRTTQRNLPKPGPTIPPSPADTVPAMLRPGEHVMNPGAVQLMGGHGPLDEWNRRGIEAEAQGGLPGYAAGGAVMDWLGRTTHGLIGPSANAQETRDRTAALQNGTAQALPEPVTMAAAPQAPAAVAAPAPTVAGAAQALRGRAAQIDAAAGYAFGGEVEDWRRTLPAEYQQFEPKPGVRYVDPIRQRLADEAARAPKAIEYRPTPVPPAGGLALEPKSSAVPGIDYTPGPSRPTPNWGVESRGTAMVPASPPNSGLIERAGGLPGTNLVPSGQPYTPNLPVPTGERGPTVSGRDYYADRYGSRPAAPSMTERMSTAAAKPPNSMDAMTRGMTAAAAAVPKVAAGGLSTADVIRHGSGQLALLGMAQELGRPVFDQGVAALKARYPDSGWFRKDSPVPLTPEAADTFINSPTRHGLVMASRGRTAEDLPAANRPPNMDRTHAPTDIGSGLSPEPMGPRVPAGGLPGTAVRWGEGNFIAPGKGYDANAPINAEGTGLFAGVDPARTYGQGLEAVRGGLAGAGQTFNAADGKSWSYGGVPGGGTVSGFDSATYAETAGKEAAHRAGMAAVRVGGDYQAAYDRVMGVTPGMRAQQMALQGKEAEAQMQQRVAAKTPAGQLAATETRLKLDAAQGVPGAVERLAAWNNAQKVQENIPTTVKDYNDMGMVTGEHIETVPKYGEYSPARSNRLDPTLWKSAEGQAMEEERGILTSSRSPEQRLARTRQLYEMMVGQGGGLPGPQAAGGAPAMPTVGTTMQGYRFKGGDPSRRENWEKA